MHTDAQAFDGSEDQAPLPADAQEIEQRLVVDAARWDAESPDDGALADYARALADESDTTAMGEPLTDGKVSIGGGRTSAQGSTHAVTFPPRRPSAWAASLVTLSVVAAMALVLLLPALRPGPRAGESPTPTASVTAEATDTPPADGTHTPRATATTSGTGLGGGPGAGFSVTRVVPAVDMTQTPNASGDTSLTIISSNWCGQTTKIALNITFYTSNRVSQGKITYRWHRSDGYVSGPIWFLYGDMTGAPLSYAPAQGGEWDLPSLQADGSMKWVDVEVLEPNPITARLNLQVTCTFSAQGASASASPGAYNCSAGGDQTFTFAGSISGSYAPGSSTVTYHWLHSDGTVTPDQTATFGPGVTSVAAQPDAWVIHPSDVGPGSSRWDQLVVTSPSPGTVSNQQMISTSCP